jgi:sugar transferase (PEP-CTERM system associated)
MLKIGNHYVSKVICGLLFLEFLILIGAFFAGASLQMPAAGGAIVFHPDYLLTAGAVFAGLILLSMGAMGMYQNNLSEALYSQFLRHLLPAFLLGFCLLKLASQVMPELNLGMSTLVVTYLIGAGGIMAARSVIAHTTRMVFLDSRILVLGSGPIALKCGLLTKRSALRYFELVGYVPLGVEETCVPAQQLLYLEPDGSLLALARRLRVSEIIVSVQNRRGGSIPIRDLLECKMAGILVTEASSFVERESCQIQVESIQPSFLVFGGGFDQSFLRSAMKRCFDLLVSLVLLVLTLPLMLVTALAILLEDGGPVFYSQERVGLDGRVFRVLKLRSMRTDAEKAGPQFAGRRDSRITRVGNVIRKLRIDELPQIFNVLKGEMSFVGPRPERPYFVEQLNRTVPYYNLRHSVKPGITGWAQVRYGYGDSVEDALQKLKYDMYYVKNHSLLLDLLVLIDTFEVVVFGSGR